MLGRCTHTDRDGDGGDGVDLQRLFDVGQHFDVLDAVCVGDADDKAVRLFCRVHDLQAVNVLYFSAGKLAAEAGRAGVPITVCGEMAGRPLEAMTLIGLGFSSLSMTAGALPPVKAMIRSLKVGPLSSYLFRLIEAPDRSVREILKAYAADHGIAI